MITAPTLSWTLDSVGSTASVPMSPQSRLRAHCPEVKSLRVSPTSRLISSGGPYLVESQIDLEGLAETLGAGERLHVGRVEEDPLLGALGLQPAAGDAEDRPIGLGIALLGDARAVVALAVAVHIHALGSLGDVDIVGPGLRRLLAELLQHVGPVVDHLEVAIEGDHVVLAGVGLGEIAEEGRRHPPPAGPCRRRRGGSDPRDSRASRNRPSIAGRRPRHRCCWCRRPSRSAASGRDPRRAR